MTKTPLGEWLERQFLRWQSEQGERQTLDAFAQYMGVSRSTLNKWMNGTRTPDTLDTIDLLADKLGPEVYDLLGKSRPDPRLQTIIKHWGMLPDAVKDDLLKRAQNGSTPAGADRVMAPSKRKQKT